MHSAAAAISVVVPAFNEAGRVGESLRTIAGYLALNMGSSSELILVDDGSHDDTVGVARQALLNEKCVQFRSIRYEQNKGKGFAVRTGLMAARAPIAMFTDADLSSPITELPKLLNPIVAGERDVTFGSRALDRNLIGRHQPMLRETGGRVFNLLARIATRLPFWDTQCGFKAFRMSVFRPILEAATLDRFGFDVELLFVAHRAGLRLLEIPVRWNHQDGSKVSVGRDALRMVAELKLIRARAATGTYDEAIRQVRTVRARECVMPSRVSQPLPLAGTAATAAYVASASDSFQTNRPRLAGARMGSRRSRRQA